MATILRGITGVLPGPPWNVTATIRLARPLDPVETSYDQEVDQLNQKRLKLVIQWNHHPGE